MKVVVIGAGIIGASIAEELSRRGADVTVLDMRGPGRGASHASAGMLAPYIEAVERTPLLDLSARSLGLFDRYINRMRDSSGMSIEYARTGTLEVALDSDGATQLLGTKIWLDGAGVEAEWLDGDAVREFEPSVTPAALGGLYIPIHGFVGADALLRAMIQSAKLAGAAFEVPVEAAAIESHEHDVEVQAGDRTYVADVAVLATGSWSKRVRIAGVNPLPVRPVRGQLLHLHWCESDQPSRIVWGPGCYTVPWSDGSLLVGATSEDVGFDEGTTVAGIHALTSAVSELLPHSVGARVEAVRVGLRPALPDDLPALGPIGRAPRVIVATGHFRNGVLLAPITADIVGRYLIDRIEDPALQLTTPDRFWA